MNEGARERCSICGEPQQCPTCAGTWPGERPDAIPARMNDHERRAWGVLRGLGAAATELGGKPALDLRSARAKDDAQRSDLIGAIIDVAGRSGSNRRHQDRRGNAVFVVTDDRSMADV